jgi:siroheme synthase
MGRETNMTPTYEILAYITMDKDRVIGGKALSLLAKDEEDQKTLTLDLAKALKADVAQLKSGDYIVLRV